MTLVFRLPEMIRNQTVALVEVVDGTRDVAKSAVRHEDQ